ncbi:MAG: hypothetical protein O7G84_13740, partial [Gammaproteobacteria bacterium]|nr:hypothetical protein [Gammaproteobacteria bacterium]
IVSVVLASYAPFFFDELPESEIRESRLLLILFGGTIAVRMLFWPARGILTGFHMTTVTAAVTAAGDLLLLVALFSTLIFGGGLSNLALAVLISTVVTEAVRSVFAKHATADVTWTSPS